MGLGQRRKISVAQSLGRNVGGCRCNERDSLGQNTVRNLYSNQNSSGKSISLTTTRNCQVNERIAKIYAKISPASSLSELRWFKNQANERDDNFPGVNLTFKSLSSHKQFLTLYVFDCPKYGTIFWSDNFS